tara:strand:+ start:543 stop:773 length:231 start_codon:yes stop_codon:yes gene_type:complete
MNFDIKIYSQDTSDVYKMDGRPVWNIEVTENYEGDKWHVVVFEIDDLDFNHFDTRGFDTPNEVFEYLRELGNFPKE